MTGDEQELSKLLDPLRYGRWHRATVDDLDGKVTEKKLRRRHHFGAQVGWKGNLLSQVTK